MSTEATTLSRHIRGYKAGDQIFIKTNFLQHFQYVIEHSDWDEVILAQERWLNKLSIGVIVLSSLYFIHRVLLVLLDSLSRVAVAFQ